MLDINPTPKKKMILSIDGGGMRGTITIAMLAELEKMTGIPTHQQFDMVAGTSTGAIIAAALGIGMSAQDILDTIYKQKLPNAFPSPVLPWWVYLILHLLRYTYPLEPFLRALEYLITDDKGNRRTIDSLTKPIVLMTTKDVRTSNTYFIVSKGPGARPREGVVNFQAWPVAGAVAASGAAPIFFPPVANNLVDGGVGVHGNPRLAAAVEAMEYMGKVKEGDPAYDMDLGGFQDGNVILISLGTGYVPTNVPDGAAGRFGLKKWLQYIIGESMDDAALQQVLSTRAIYGKRIDFRRYNPLLTRDNVQSELGIPLASRPNPADLGLDSRRPEEIQLMEEIGQAYARKVGEAGWTTSSYMPWIEDGERKGQGRDGGHPLPGTEDIDWSRTPYG